MKAESLVTKVDFMPTYSRLGGKIKVVTLQNLPLPEGFISREESVIELSPGATGGNHKHPRTEIFYTHVGQLTLYWKDPKGKLHKDNMSPVGGKFKMFVIPPFVPHAVVNESEDKATLVELANEPQHDVQMENLL